GARLALATRHTTVAESPDEDIAVGSQSIADDLYSGLSRVEILSENVATTAIDVWARIADQNSTILQRRGRVPGVRFCAGVVDLCQRADRVAGHVKALLENRAVE